MSAKKTIQIFILVCLFSMAGFANSITYSFADDNKHEISLEIPKGWTDVDGDFDQLYDAKFVHENCNRTCLFFLRPLEEFTDLQMEMNEAEEDIRKEFFKGRQIKNVSLQLTQDVLVNAFQVEESENEPAALVMNVIFWSDNFMFGLCVENKDLDPAALRDDCLAFLEAVNLITLQ